MEVEPANQVTFRVLAQVNLAKYSIEVDKANMFIGYNEHSLDTTTA